MNPGEINKAFEAYWTEIDVCRKAKAFWALLHITVCLPDICAALESDGGEATGKLYIKWCDKYLPSTALSGEERYSMRCTVLHQGCSFLRQPARYRGFAFGQPSQSGAIDHNRVEGTVLHLDVGELATEMKHGVQKWINDIEADKGRVSKNGERNLNSLVRVRVERAPR